MARGGVEPPTFRFSVEASGSYRYPADLYLNPSSRLALSNFTAHSP